MKYTFYESFEFTSNTSRMRTKTWLTNRVEVYTNPQPRLVELMVEKYGSKYASVNKTTNKLYVRQRVRKATVKYHNQNMYPDTCQDPRLEYAFSENSALGLNRVKEFSQNGELRSKRGKKKFD